MTTDGPTDLPSELTRLLRNVSGVHTVYATKAPIPTILTAVAEALKNEPVGVHLVTVQETDQRLEVAACIGVLADEPAVDVVRRAHDAMDDFLTENGHGDHVISVSIGRVG
jgi:hypothetical protein